MRAVLAETYLLSKGARLLFPLFLKLALGLPIVPKFHQLQVGHKQIATNLTALRILLVSLRIASAWFQHF